nr:MAG TPA: hypothetical protein [Caudoviricetes sp.]
MFHGITPHVLQFYNITLHIKSITLYPPPVLQKC